MKSSYAILLLLSIVPNLLAAPPVRSGKMLSNMASVQRGVPSLTGPNYRLVAPSSSRSTIALKEPMFLPGTIAQGLRRYQPRKVSERVNVASKNQFFQASLIAPSKVQSGKTEFNNQYSLLDHLKSAVYGNSVTSSPKLLARSFSTSAKDSAKAESRVGHINLPYFSLPKVALPSAAKPPVVPLVFRTPEWITGIQKYTSGIANSFSYDTGKEIIQNRKMKTGN